ncbi:acyl-CoA reductase [Pelagibacteraceae bacterium]|nr:acyl-CoA reductase [Pelagibacteraceae bacterium]
MLDKKILHKSVIRNNNFKVNIFQPINKLALDFLGDFSNLLRKNNKKNLTQDLLYLVFWCSRKKKELEKHKLNSFRVGRGLVFHICPSNVPTNFIYSFFFGLLSGNSNIVKLPSRDFKEKKIIIAVLNSLFNKEKYKKFRNSNLFIQYNNEIELTKEISAKCNARIIWGGDETVNNIRKVWIPERSIELTFPDRYSISIIDTNKLSKSNESTIKKLAKNFYLDGYLMNQMACNSPHCVFWIGKNKEIKNKFWKYVNYFVEKNFIFDNIHAVDKYTNLLENFIYQKKIKKLKRYNNFLYVVNLNSVIKNIENIRGVSGTFFQLDINDLNTLSQYITKKCQTATYYGLNKESIKNFILNNHLKGLDRFMPIGRALEIDVNWDGYDTIKSLSRVITIE